jgi:hypothetical protein
MEINPGYHREHLHTNLLQPENEIFPQSSNKRMRQTIRVTLIISLGFIDISSS